MSGDAEEAGSAARNSCPLCGSDRLTWGAVWPGQNHLKFKPDDLSWLEKNTIFGGLAIKARRCASCGNIQLFAPE